jgi:protoheme IX farnesyltransferase
MSSITSTASPIVASERPIARRGLLGLYLELTKARLSAMVLLTAAVGFVLGSGDRIDWTKMLWSVIGTALAAGCASALNQIIEIARDRRMHRTQNRPLPSGAMSMQHSFIAAMLMGAAGLVVLAAGANLGAAWLALLTIVLYVVMYTPLKVRSTLNTIVGAVCGAIPPMIGWVAASGSIDRGAWILGAILFVWQIPHFLALAWLYREDYERGGFAMLPSIDRKGQITCEVIVITSLLLVPIGLLATILHVAGVVFAIGSLILGAAMVAIGIRLYLNRTAANARRMFLASIIYLPLLMGLLVLDRGPVG